MIPQASIMPAQNESYDLEEAYRIAFEDFLTCLPGKPWKGSEVLKGNL